MLPDAIYGRYVMAELSVSGSAVTGGFEQNRRDVDLAVEMDGVLPFI